MPSDRLNGMTTISKSLLIVVYKTVVSQRSCLKCEWLVRNIFAKKKILFREKILIMSQIFEKSFEIFALILTLFGENFKKYQMAAE